MCTVTVLEFKHDYIKCIFQTLLWFNLAAERWKCVTFFGGICRSAFCMKTVRYTCLNLPLHFVFLISRKGTKCLIRLKLDDSTVEFSLDHSSTWRSVTFSRSCLSFKKCFVLHFSVFYYTVFTPTIVFVSSSFFYSSHSFKKWWTSFSLSAVISLDAAVLHCYKNMDHLSAPQRWSQNIWTAKPWDTDGFSHLRSFFSHCLFNYLVL